MILQDRLSATIPFIFREDIGYYDTNNSRYYWIAAADDLS